jgi:hypothetical protein
MYYIYCIITLFATYCILQMGILCNSYHFNKLQKKTPNLKEGGDIKLNYMKQNT